MNRIITNKLRSRSGASITFALLLFLVCAVISSVVLVAGTTAAGRMSGIAETDQRYYAVTSAAQLIKDKIAGADNQITTVKLVDGTAYSFAKAANKVVTSDIDSYVSDESSLASGISGLISGGAGQTFDITFKQGGAPVESMNVSVTGSYDSDTKSIRYRISNATGGASYSVDLVFKADVQHYDDDRTRIDDTRYNVASTDIITLNVDSMSTSY